MQKRFHFSVQNLHIDMVRRGIKYLCICSFILLLFHMLFMFITVAKRSKYTPFLWSSFLIDTDANVCDSHSRERKRWSPPDKPTFMQTTIALKYEIFWSELCDSYVPKGLPLTKSKRFVKSTRSKVIKTLRRGSLGMCRRGLLDAIAEFEDGTVMCVRYSENPLHAYGEAMTFYLARMLEMDNVPEVVLAKTDSPSTLWKNVNTSTLSWKNNQTVSMTRYIPNATFSVYAPQVIVDAYRENKTIKSTMNTLCDVWNSSHIAEVIQWGTLIEFDYLLGHSNRLFDWERSNQGNISEKLHNALKSPEGKIWLIDNKWAFPTKKHQQANIESLNDAFLSKICLFQISFLTALWELSDKPDPFQILWNYARSYEPLLDSMKELGTFKAIASLFEERVAKLLKLMQNCNMTLYIRNER